MLPVTINHYLSCTRYLYQCRFVEAGVVLQALLNVFFTVFRYPDLQQSPGFLCNKAGVRAVKPYKIST